MFMRCPNSNSSRDQEDEEPALCGCATSKSLFNYLFYFIYLFIYTEIQCEDPPSSRTLHET